MCQLSQQTDSNSCCAQRMVEYLLVSRAVLAMDAPEVLYVVCSFMQHFSWHLRHPVGHLAHSCCGLCCANFSPVMLCGLCCMPVGPPSLLRPAPAAPRASSRIFPPLLHLLPPGRAGVPMEVMGLMLGEFVDDYTVRVVDVFAMPQSGTGVSVEAVDPVFQTKMLDMLKQVGRSVTAGCWLLPTAVLQEAAKTQLAILCTADACGCALLLHQRVAAQMAQ